MRKVTILVAVVLAGCGAGTVAPTDPSLVGSTMAPLVTTTEVEPSTTTGEPSSTTAPPTTTIQPSTTALEEPVATTDASYDPSLQGLIDLAIADLAGRFNVDSASITVSSAEAIVWPDGSLGCPQPGMAYTQVQVEGARIILLSGGLSYPYHSGGSRLPFWCQKN